ncbi:hypothetical protein ACFX1W_022798 [Malus domestica]
MSGPSNCCFDLNFGEEAALPSQDNIWRPSLLSSTGFLTVGDSVMKNDMTVAVLAKNLLSPKDNRLLSKRLDELAVKNSLTLSVQCASFVSNMAQRLFARTRQVESLAVEVISLKQEVRGHKPENKQLQRLAHDYVTNMKRKAVLRSEVPNDQPSVPPPFGVLPSTEAPNDHPPVPTLFGALPTAETSHEQPL